MRSYDLQDLFLTFDGRLTRRDYWLGYLAVVGVLVIVGAGPVRLFGPGEGAVIWITVVSFICAVAGTALSMKRLHDRDKSGWWVVLFYIVPGLMSDLAARFMANSAGVSVLLIIAAALSFWGLAEMGFRRGTVGKNRYGEDPLDSGA